ncbi:hypothetical protein GGQ26_06535 [Aeromicrobium sp. zg-629]|nr:hypothetical protein [Aeromicrobium senzhongii]
MREADESTAIACHEGIDAPLAHARAFSSTTAPPVAVNSTDNRWSGAMRAATTASLLSVDVEVRSLRMMVSPNRPVESWRSRAS